MSGHKSLSGSARPRGALSSAGRYQVRRSQGCTWDIFPIFTGAAVPKPGRAGSLNLQPATPLVAVVPEP
jgi:hypothetical protein